MASTTAVNPKITKRKVYSLRALQENLTGYAFVAPAVITLIPILAIYFLTQKQFTQGIATTGLKG